MNATRTTHHRTLLIAAAITFGIVAFAETAAAQDGPPDGRQPIITNQFSTTTGGALQARRPGLFIQQGVGVQQGTLDFFDGGVVDTDSFFRETVMLVFQGFMDSITSFLSTINLAADLGGLFGGGTGTGTGTATPGTLTNGTTTGQGTMTPVP